MPFSLERVGAISARTWRSVGQELSAMAQKFGPGLEVKGAGSWLTSPLWRRTSAEAVPVEGTFCTSSGSGP